MRLQAAFVLWITILLSSPAEAGADVWIVDASGQGEHTSIQDAVIAAKSGDTLLIRPGSYPGFVIMHKSLHLVSDQEGPVIVNGRVRVVDLAPWQRVTLSDLSIFGGSQVALQILGCEGHVRVRSSALASSIAAALVESSDDVAFTDCALLGLKGASAGARGGHGLHARSSSVALHGCVLHGGDGADGEDASSCIGWPCTDGGNGGNGAMVELGSFVYASGSHFEPGDPGEGGYGWDTCDCFPGFDGYAIRTASNGAATLLDCSTQGLVFGNVEELPGVRRRVEIASLLDEYESSSVTFTGLPGDTVRLFVSPDAGFDYQPLHFGVDLLGEPFASELAGRGGPVALGRLQFPESVTGTIPAGGSLQLPLRVLPLDPAVQAVPHYVQAHFTDPSGRKVLSNTGLTMAFSQAAYVVDCPPGTCEPPPVVYVDAAAPGDPGPEDPSVSDPLEDGSVEHPFDSIQKALVSVATGGTVIVRDGIYTGHGNRNLDLVGRAIHLASENGPESCIVDAENQAFRLLRFENGEPSGAVVEGITFRRSSAGAIRVDNGFPRIHRCVIADNTVQPPIFVAGGQPTISNCIVRDNSVSGNLGGGALRAQGTATQITVRNCSFVSNVASTGSAIRSVARMVRLQNSTIAGNGGGFDVIHLQGNPSSSQLVELQMIHSVVWSNVGTPIYLGPNGSRARIEYSNVEGGQGGVAGPGTIQWAMGNIGLDPLFVAPELGDFHISKSSPCVDAGQPGFPTESDETDIDGEPRLINGIIDMGSDEFFEDCNRNGIPDVEEGLALYSPIFSPIGAGHTHVYTIFSPPPAAGPVLFEFFARADLAQQNQRVTVWINDAQVASVFSLNGSHCPLDPDRAVLVVPAAQFNAAVAGGDAVITLQPSSAVNPECVPPTSMLYFAMYYDNDCNGNGVLDECDIASGTSQDQNGNGVPDECE